MKHIALIATLALAACIPSKIEIHNAGSETTKRGALGGIPGGGFIPPTKIGSGGGTGDITAVTVTGPIAGGGASGSVNLSLSLCAASQILKMNGGATAWACAADAGGFDTAGTGLTSTGTTVNVIGGSGITANANDVAIDPMYTQRRVSGTCAAGSSIRVIDSAGAVTCETDDDTNTTYTASTGLSLASTVFSLGLCGSDGQVWKRVAGVMVCAADAGITGTLTNGTIPIATGASTLGDSTITDSGSVVTVASRSLSVGVSLDVDGVYSGFGSTDYAWYIDATNTRPGFACLYGTNATGTCAINAVGYQASTTQTRSLGVYDGTGTASGDTIAFFDGATRLVTIQNDLRVVDASQFDGASDFNGNVRTGDGDADTITTRGRLGFTGSDVSVSSGSCTVAGEAQSFTITSSDPMSSCVIALNRTFTVPRCVWSAMSSIAAGGVATPGLYGAQTTTTFTLAMVSGTMTNGGIFNVHCFDDLD